MEEKQKNHSFRKGLVCGILVCVLGITVCGCGAAWMLGRLGLAGLNGLASGSDQSEVSSKMQELQSYIDRYFLFDYAKEDEEMRNL